MVMFKVLFRTAFFYILVVSLYRVMGKREVGELGIIDLIVSVLIAELVAISIENLNTSIWRSIIPIVMLSLFQIIIAYISLKSVSSREFFDGKPSVIINKGKINFKEMIRQRYNLDDLLTQLRENEVRSISEVEYAILEVTGKLSVFKNNLDMSGSYPIPLIIDGKLEEDTLKNIDKDYKWLEKKLAKEDVDIKDCFYAFYKGDKLFLIKNDELE